MFAETDIVNLVKSGIPSTEILCSLADAIVLQNLSVLTRGITLRHKVLLLGGPNTYLPFLQECWRKRIPETWDERGYDVPEGRADRGARSSSPRTRSTTRRSAPCVYGLHEAAEVGLYTGIDGLVDYMTERPQGAPRRERRPAARQARRTSSTTSASSTRSRSSTPMKLEPGQVVRGVIGLDGGSTSSKAVLIDEDGEILCKAYQLSKGNPIQDTKELLAQLRDVRRRTRARRSRCMGFGATGYAADVLAGVRCAPT